jgi:hypothetical protein
MNVIECLAVLHEENMAMVKALLRSAEAEDDARRRSSSDIILTWPLEPGEILTPVSTPTEYDYRVRHAQAAKDAP